MANDRVVLGIQGLGIQEVGTSIPAKGRFAPGLQPLKLQRLKP